MFAERVRFIEVDGVRILFADYSEIRSTAQLRAVVAQASSMIVREPKDSVLVLVKLDGVPYAPENVGVFRAALRANRPFVRARAVCGFPSIAQIAFTALQREGGRRMYTFDTVDEAVQWLVRNAAPTRGEALPLPRRGWLRRERI